MDTVTINRTTVEQALEKLEFFAHMKSVSEDTMRLITALRQALEQPHPAPPELEAAVNDALGLNAQQQEPVAWISVKDALPKAVRGISYKQSLTDVVLVRHSDRPDYPITAHAVVGEGLGAGVAIPTNGASEQPEIAWYSASSNLNNPFDLKNDDYERYLPKVFGSKITHWKPINTHPPVIDKYAAVRIATALGWEPKREWAGLTDEDVVEYPYPPAKPAVYATASNTKAVRDGYEMGGYEKEPPYYSEDQLDEFARAIEAKLKGKNT